MVALIIERAYFLPADMPRDLEGTFAPLLFSHYLTIINVRSTHSAESINRQTHKNVGMDIKFQRAFSIYSLGFKYFIHFIMGRSESFMKCSYSYWFRSTLSCYFFLMIREKLNLFSRKFG